MNDLNKNPIVVGLTAMIAGGASLYLFVFRKMQAATAGVENIYTSFAASGLGPICMLMGLFYVLVKPQSLKPEEMLPKQRILYWTMAAIGFIIGLSTAFWLKNYIKEAGYARPL